MAITGHRASVRIMLAGVTLLVTGRFAHDARSSRLREAEPDWMAALGA
jgi:hypothetical protein